MNDQHVILYTKIKIKKPNKETDKSKKTHDDNQRNQKSYSYKSRGEWIPSRKVIKTRKIETWKKVIKIKRQIIDKNINQKII